MSQGVLPSQILTLDSGRAAPSSITSGGGAKGQPDALPIGYSGTSETASVAVPARVSDTSHSSMWMASAGQPAAALRALSACSAGGLSLSSSTTPSSSRWSKSSGAGITQFPEDAHLSWSTVTFIIFYSQLLHSCGVTGANQSPTTASMRPDPAACHEGLGTDAPAAIARSRSAQVCISRLRAIRLRSTLTSMGSSGRQRLIPSITWTSDSDVSASLTTML